MRPLKRCRFCNNYIDIAYNICPVCAKKQNSPAKYIVIGAAIFLLFILILNPKDNGTSDAEVSNAETITPTEKPAPEYIEITSTALIDAYNENSVKCKQLYDGKILKVTGNVNSVGEDILGNIYVTLDHDTDFVFIGIQCYARDKEVEMKIAELKEGDLITVIGKGDSGPMSFSLDKAVIK